MEGITLLEAAARLGISERTLRRRIKTGEVKAEKATIDGGGTAWKVYLETDNVPATVPDKLDKRAGSVPAAAPDSADANRMQEMREEIIFLRNVIEQQQRAEAELRAALRESLKALPKALNAPERAGQPATVPDKRAGSVPDNVPTVPTAQNEPPAPPQRAQNEPATLTPQNTQKDDLAIQMQVQTPAKSTFISRITNRLRRKKPAT